VAGGSVATLVRPAVDVDTEEEDQLREHGHDQLHDQGDARDHGHPHDQLHHHGHPHDHGAHEHPHDRGPQQHPHQHEHLPAPAPAAPGGTISRRGLVAMGLAGGLLPSPSAVLVLLGAIALGHPLFGVALVVAFGLGMAITLAVVGVVVMRLRERAERRLALRPGSRATAVLRLAPLLTAVVVVALGAALATRGLQATGLG
jgi:nickel/cobalt transporter (NicO) family protein